MTVLEALNKLNPDLKVIYDPNALEHRKLRSDVEERIDRLRNQNPATRLDSKVLISSQVGPRIRALIEIMGYITEDSKGRELEASVKMGWDLGRNFTYKGIGYHATTLDFSAQRPGTGIPVLEIVTDEAVRPGFLPQLKFNTYPPETSDPYFLEVIAFRERAFASLTGTKDSLLYLQILNDLSILQTGESIAIPQQKPGRLSIYR